MTRSEHAVVSAIDFASYSTFTSMSALCVALALITSSTPHNRKEKPALRVGEPHEIRFNNKIWVITFISHCSKVLHWLFVNGKVIAISLISRCVRAFLFHIFSTSTAQIWWIVSEHELLLCRNRVFDTFGNRNVQRCKHTQPCANTYQGEKNRCHCCHKKWHQLVMYVLYALDKRLTIPCAFPWSAACRNTTIGNIFARRECMPKYKN